MCDMYTEEMPYKWRLAKQKQISTSPTTQTSAQALTRHAGANVVVLAGRVLEQVLAGADAPHLVGEGGDEAALVTAVAAGLPEDGAAKALLGEVVGFLDGGLDVVVADELARGRVVRVAGHGHIIVLLAGAGLGQVLVQPHARLDAAGADTVVRVAPARRWPRTSGRTAGYPA